MTQFHLLEKGEPSSPPVLCLHGLLGSARNLYRLVDAIGAAGFRTVAYDQRGHGHSPHATDYSLRAMAEDLFRVMDQLRIDHAHVVGHSMGARVAIKATSLAPRRIRSLALLDSGITIRRSHLESLRKIIDPLPSGYPNRAEAEQALSGHSTMLKQFLLANLRAESSAPHALRWIFDLDGIRRELLRSIETDQTELYQNIACPILVARGELSDSMTAEDSALMLKLNPNARGAVIEKAGHWVHADNISRTIEVVVGFLKAVQE